jgi:hypothetical protein
LQAGTDTWRLREMKGGGLCTSRHKRGTRDAGVAGADVEAQAADGARPLHCALVIGCAETMGALLELGVDIHAVGEDGCTALREASSSEAVQLLLRLCLRQPATVMLRR